MDDRVAAAFAGPGRTVTRGSILFAFQLANYDIVLVGSAGLGSTTTRSDIEAYLRRGGAIMYLMDNFSAQTCADRNALFADTGLSFDCVAQRRTGTISNKFNALAAVSGNIPLGTDYIYVLGGGNAARLAGPSSSNMVARTADYQCGRAVLWGDVEFGTPSVYHASTWSALAPWLLSGP
jgi:hypothetical protein